MVMSQSILSESVTLSIRDNGCGFDPKHVIGEHLGLGIMQERALNAQVQLSIRSKPGRGTEIALRWPMPEKQSSPER